MNIRIIQIAVLCFTAGSAQAGLLGEPVRASYVVPAGTVFTPGEFSVQNFLVTTNVESTKFGTTGNVKLDIGDDYLELTSLFMGRTIYDVGQYKFKFTSPAVSLDSVTVVDLGPNLYTTGGSPTQFNQARVSYNSNELTLNMAGLSVPGNAVIRLAIQSSAVPEASNRAMLILSLPLCAWAIRRNRAA